MAANVVGIVAISYNGRFYRESSSLHDMTLITVENIRKLWYRENLFFNNFAVFIVHI